MRRKRKNRKKEAQGFVFPIPLALFLALVTVTSMAYLWMHGRCEAAGMRIQQLERTLERAHQRRSDEERKWSQMKTLPNVQQAVARLGLNMSWAQDNRIVQISRGSVSGAERSAGELAHLTGIGHGD
jgi:flagellar basal body-associated protein FliL